MRRSLSCFQNVGRIFWAGFSVLARLTLALTGPGAPTETRLRGWARGGVIGLVENGDRIAIDLAERNLDLLVEPAELDRRRAAYVAPAPRITRGYLKFYADHVAPASEGAVLPR